MSKANTICVDFDKTLCVDDQFGEVNFKVAQFIKSLWHDRYNIILHTARSDSDYWKINYWLKENKLYKYISDIAAKPEGVIYLDDRAYPLEWLEKSRDVQQNIDYVKERSRELLE